MAAMPKRPNKKPPPDDPNKAAKAVVDRVIEETKGTQPSDDPNVAAKATVDRLIQMTEAEESDTESLDGSSDDDS